MPNQAGTVLWFNRKLGYGWAVPDDGSNDIFVHRSHLQSDRKYLNENDRISFDVGEHRGKPCAVNVVFLGAAEPKTEVRR